MSGWSKGTIQRWRTCDLALCVLHLIPPTVNCYEREPHILNQRPRRMLLVGLDLETTDTDVSRAKIVQFAAVARCPGWIPEPGVESNFLVDPECPIPSSATAVHHITDDMVRGKQAFSERVPAIVDLLSKATQQGSALVGYNVRRYDLPLLQHSLAQLGFVGQAPMVVDVCDLVNWYYRHLPSSKLAAVAENFGCGFETYTAELFADRVNLRRSISESFESVNVGTLDAIQRPHDALSDVRATFRVLDKLREYLKLPDTLEGDYALLRLSLLAGIRVDAEYDQFKHFVYRDRDDWNKVEPTYRLGFGKHCGYLLDEIPSGYRGWLEREVIPDVPIAAQAVFKLYGYRVPTAGGAK